MRCCRTYRNSYSSRHETSESDKDVIACILLIRKEVITEPGKKFKITRNINKKVNPLMADLMRLAFFTDSCPQ